jgi:acetate kinase
LLAAAAHGNRRAEVAVTIFCYRARKYIGAYLAAMSGADAIVFTGGIGENSPTIRARICSGLEWAGLSLDEERNNTAIGAESVITRVDSRLAAYVIPTDEELLIARDTARCVQRAASPG